MPVRAPTRIPASIEISPKQAIDSPDLPGLCPPGTRVYITDITPTDAAALTQAALRVRTLGYEPVPHIAARRLTTRAALEERLAALAGAAGVSDVLVIGGGPEKPAGEFDSTLAVLETGLFGRYRIGRIAIAGHPEGSPDFTEQTALRLLEMKQAFARRVDAEMRIVTQFGFDAGRILDWAAHLAASGIDLPVHIGVSGPARLTSLIKYATACGVGSSLDFLKKQAGKLTTLVTGFAPDSVVDPIEGYWRTQPHGAIRQIHVFAFGGMKPASNWLYERGSWS